MCELTTRVCVLCLFLFYSFEHNRALYFEGHSGQNIYEHCNQVHLMETKSLNIWRTFHSRLYYQGISFVLRRLIIVTQMKVYL